MQVTSRSTTGRRNDALVLPSRGRRPPRMAAGARRLPAARRGARRLTTFGPRSHGRRAPGRGRDRRAETARLVRPGGRQWRRAVIGKPAPPRGRPLRARRRMPAAHRAAGETPGSDSPCAPAPASSCAPFGALRDRPASLLPTSAPAGAAARMDALGPRSRGRRAAGRGRDGGFNLHHVGSRRRHPIPLCDRS